MQIQKVEALLRATKTVLQEDSFEVIARRVFDECCRITGATSGYVALLSDDGSENEVLFLEAGSRPCSVDPELPMPIRGLREISYRENRVAYDNDFMNSEWVKFMPSGHVTMDNVLFSPLVIDNKTVGIMGIANKDGDFNEDDAEMAGAFGELAAIALSNSRDRDAREQAIRDLNNALDEIKTLKGLIPICSYCKQIRNDEGAWERIEAYISSHSEARFSHGICNSCLDEHYPDVSNDIRNSTS